MHSLEQNWALHFREGQSISQLMYLEALMLDVEYGFHSAFDILVMSSRGIAAHCSFVSSRYSLQMLQ